MPSIKNFKNAQSSNIQNSSLGLWGMLDEFKTMIPVTINQIEKQDSNGTQTVLKEDSNGTQTVLKEDSNSTQTVLKEYSKRYSKEDSNGTQTVLKRYSKQYSESQLNSIGGNQRILLFYVYNLCKINGSKITPPLCKETICKNTIIKKGTVKTAINRLIKKHFLIIENSKTGRSGWVTFRIPDFVYQELFNDDISLSLTQTVLKGDSKGTQTVLKEYSERYSERYSPPPVSSSYIINTTTNVPEIFKQIDYSPLASFGFDESHIIQIYREHTKHPEFSLSAEIIQNSIYALAYDLKHNDVAGSFKNAPVVVLTALLKKGQPYSSKTPHKVLSPREEAMQEYIAAQEKRHHQIQELENKTKEFELLEWLKSLSEEELTTFVPQDPCPQGMPEKVYQTSCRKKAQAAAKEYFSTIIWPQKLNQFEALKQNPKPESDPSEN